MSNKELSYCLLSRKIGPNGWEEYKCYSTRMAATRVLNRVKTEYPTTDWAVMLLINYVEGLSDERE